MVDASAFQSRLAELRRQYLVQLADYDRAVAGAWETIQTATLAEQRAEAVKVLRFNAHKLFGTGSTFGFPTISEAGEALERYLLTTQNGEGPVTAMAPLVAALRKAVADARDVD